MKRLMYGLLIILCLLIAATQVASAESQNNTVSSVVIRQEGRVLDSLSYPQAFAYHSLVFTGDPLSGIEVEVNLEPRQGQKVIVITELDGAIFSIISSEGADVEQLENGCIFEFSRGVERAAFTLYGTIPLGTKDFCVLEVITHEGGTLTNSLYIRGIMPNPLLAWLPLIIPGALVFLVLLILVQ